LPAEPSPYDLPRLEQHPFLDSKHPVDLIPASRAFAGIPIESGEGTEDSDPDRIENRSDLNLKKRS